MCDRKNIAVVIPALNESRTIAEVVRGVRAHGCDVFVVNDASTDDTRERALGAGAEVLTLPFRAGAWCAVQAGLLHAMEQGRYDGFLTMDGDGQHDPASVPALVDGWSDSGVDVVIGSCPARASTARRIAWSFFRCLTGLKVRDLTSGLRLYGARAAAAVLTRRAAMYDYQDLGVLLLLRRRDFSLHEQPVAMHARCDGCSRVFRSWWAVTVYMLKTGVLILSDRMAGADKGDADGREYDAV